MDQVFAGIAAASGRGSAAARGGLLAGLFARATSAEQGFLARLVVGELRQGALEGVMVEALARAVQLPVRTIRRALMLTGNLTEVAEVALTQGAAGLEQLCVQLFKPLAPMLAQPAYARPRF